LEPYGRKWQEILNSATGEAIAQVPRGSEEDVARAVEAADWGIAEWPETPPGERARMLHKLADAVEENAEDLARLETKNVGKPISLSREELHFIVDNLRFFAGACRVLEGKSAGEYLRGYTSMVRREPVGVVGQITPWNYPLVMAGWKVGRTCGRRATTRTDRNDACWVPIQKRQVER
jgi:acyl-CoA reductase-like NAD-dependent aldehyde dehydrogenase